MRPRTLVAIGAVILPSAAFALGGEGIVGGFLKGAGILVAWFAITIWSFFWRFRRFEFAWFVIWAVRLSLPMYILWEIGFP